MFLPLPRLVAQAPQIRGLVSCLRDGPHNVDYVPRLSMALPALFLYFSGYLMLSEDRANPELG